MIMINFDYSYSLRAANCIISLLSNRNRQILEKTKAWYQSQNFNLIFICFLRNEKTESVKFVYAYRTFFKYD